MARKKKVQVETPPPTAPKRWKAVLAKHWQSHGGKWAAPQHYNCTYMAMFPPELPHYFIKRFTKLGDTVLDPFSGRGTTAVEASAQGRIGIGNDLNPLAVALSRGKISNPKLEPVLARLKELEAGFNAKQWKINKEPDKIKMIYHPSTLSQLCYLKGNLDWSKQGVDAFLVSVLMGAMHGSSSGFLSVSMPNTFSMGWNYVKKYIKEKKLECPDRDVFEVLEKRVKRYLKKGYLAGSGEVIEGDVRDLDSKVEHNSVQLLFTSPPYLKVIKYGLYNWIRLWFLTESGSHEEVDAKLDDTHALNEYLEFMKDTLTATLPLLDRKRGLSCWAIGDVKGLNLAWAVWYHAGSKIEVKADDGVVLKYKLIAIVEDKIPPNQKVTKMWKSEYFIIGPKDDESSKPISKFDSFEAALEAHSAIKEVKSILELLNEKIPKNLDGKKAILHLKSLNKQWKQTEWPGFYFEISAQDHCSKSYEDYSVKKYNNTNFDGFIPNFIFDFKAHSMLNQHGKKNRESMLNDTQAIQDAVADHPLIFIVSRGVAEYDLDGSFKQWHDELKGVPSDYVVEGKKTKRGSRTRKTSFTRQELVGIPIFSDADLRGAINDGWMKEISQGKNSNGEPRPTKYALIHDQIPEERIIRHGDKTEFGIKKIVLDKRGKATSVDRILIIAPESSSPKTFMKPEELDWKPFHTPKNTTLDDFTS